MYKQPDFRCLKPKEGIPSSAWPHFEMSGYRAAKTKQELQNVKEIKFNRYFFNWEDPTVWKEMTDTASKQSQQIWKDTFGFDTVHFTKGNSQPLTYSDAPCAKDCLEAEFGRFARSCRRAGGVFKCCMSA